MKRRHPRSPLFPYTTLFRSDTSSASDEHIDLNLIHAMMERVRSGEYKNIQSVLIVKNRSEEHTSELQSRRDLVCRLLLEKKKNTAIWYKSVKRSKKMNQSWK